ncbi:MAG TPA: hypothetical protein VG318_08550 [Actinomycetota bacterium]|nr:hypothetical protein [Actinomycetota bacterium]
MRELFVEELATVTGGGGPCPECWNTTMACCEEGPFDGCCNWWQQITDPPIVIDP